MRGAERPGFPMIGHSSAECGG